MHIVTVFEELVTKNNDFRICIFCTSAVPYSHCAKFCLVCKTIFCTHQNFCKHYETSKIPSTSFGGCKNFVRQENPLFLDIHPSLGHQISQHMDYEANDTVWLPAILIELDGSAQKPQWITGKSSNYSLTIRRYFYRTRSQENGARKTDFEPRFCRARKYPLRVKTTAMAG